MEQKLSQKSLDFFCGEDDVWCKRLVPPEIWLEVEPEFGEKNRELSRDVRIKSTNTGKMGRGEVTAAGEGR